MKLILAAILLVSGIGLTILGFVRQTDPWVLVWGGKTVKAEVVSVKAPPPPFAPIMVDDKLVVTYRFRAGGAAEMFAQSYLPFDAARKFNIGDEFPVRVMRANPLISLALPLWSWRTSRWFLLSGFVLILVGTALAFRHTARSNLVDR